MQPYFSCFAFFANLVNVLLQFGNWQFNVRIFFGLKSVMIHRWIDTGFVRKQSFAALVRFFRSVFLMILAIIRFSILSVSSNLRSQLNYFFANNFCKFFHVELALAMHWKLMCNRQINILIFLLYSSDRQFLADFSACVPFSMSLPNFGLQFSTGQTNSAWWTTFDFSRASTVFISTSKRWVNKLKFLFIISI